MPLLPQAELPSPRFKSKETDLSCQAFIYSAGEGLCAKLS